MSTDSTVIAYMTHCLIFRPLSASCLTDTNAKQALWPIKGLGDSSDGYGAGLVNPATAITFIGAVLHFPIVYYRIIKGQFLSHHACMIWEVWDPLSR